MIAVGWNLALPEIGLTLWAMAGLMFGAFFGKDDRARLLSTLTVAALLIAAAAVGFGHRGDGIAWGGMFLDDAWARFAKVTVLLSAAAVLAISAPWMEREGMLRFEFPILVALASVGMCFMVSAGDLLMLYMGLELQSLSFYVMAAMRRDSGRSSEAGLKYFVLGALSSGMLLYGISLTYGFAGSTDFATIAAQLTGGALPVGLLFGLVFVMVGLAFKVSAVPFHMWTPDVYEGAPTPVTAFFATAPKVAAMALLGRVLMGAFGPAAADWQQIVAVISLLSMFLGSIAGIGQRDLKRLLAYSSIAHMGFALVGLASASPAGLQSMLLYMAIYAVMNVGTFALLLMMNRDGRAASDIAGLSLLARRAPGQALALMILLFSLAGVPPFLGFFAKFGVLAAAVQAGLAWLAVAGVIASVIGAWYYLRIVYLMYFGAEGDAVQLWRAPMATGMLVLTALMVTAGAISMLGADRNATIAAEGLARAVPAAAASPAQVVLAAPGATGAGG